MTPNDQVKLAEFAGWKFGKDHLKGLCQPPPYKFGVVTIDKLPAYDTDANAALALVEKLVKDGWNVQMNKNQKAIYVCYFYQTRGTEVHGSGETFCLAVCSAVLKVIE